MNHFQMQIPLYECVICWEEKYAVVLCKPEKGEHAVCADCTMCVEHVNGIVKCPYCKAIWDDTNSTKTWCNVPRQKQPQLHCDEDWHDFMTALRHHSPPQYATFNTQERLVISPVDVDTFTERSQWGVPTVDAQELIRNTQVVSFLGDVQPSIQLAFNRMENIMLESVWRASQELQEQQNLLPSEPAYLFDGAPATFIEKEGVWYRKTAMISVHDFMEWVTRGRLGIFHNGHVIVYMPIMLLDDTRRIEIDGSLFNLADIVSLDEYHRMTPSKKEEFDANQPDIHNDCMYLYLLDENHSDNADE